MPPIDGDKSGRSDKRAGEFGTISYFDAAKSHQLLGERSRVPIRSAVSVSSAGSGWPRFQFSLAHRGTES